MFIESLEASLALFNFFVQGFVQNAKYFHNKTEFFYILKVCQNSGHGLLNRQTARFGLKINYRVGCTYSFALETSGNALDLHS